MRPAWNTISNTADEDEWEEAHYKFISAVQAAFFDDYGDKPASYEDEWLVVGFPLWHATVDGIFLARNPHDVLRSITVNSQWTLDWRIEKENKKPVLRCRLSHHDVPTGASFSARPFGDEWDEQ